MIPAGSNSAGIEKQVTTAQIRIVVHYASNETVGNYCVVRETNVDSVYEGVLTSIRFSLRYFGHARGSTWRIWRRGNA